MLSQGVSVSPAACGGGEKATRASPSRRNHPPAWQALAAVQWPTPRLHRSRRWKGLGRWRLGLRRGRVSLGRRRIRLRRCRGWNRRGGGILTLILSYGRNSECGEEEEGRSQARFHDKYKKVGNVSLSGTRRKHFCSSGYGIGGIFFWASSSCSFSKGPQGSFR